MYRSKAWLAGLLAAGLLAGSAGMALGHGPQEQGGMPYGYGMGQDMMGPGMDREGAMHHGPGMHQGKGMHQSHGMYQSHGMHHQHSMHHAMHPRMHSGPGMMMGPATGRGIGPGMIYGWPDGRGQDISVEDARGWLDRRLAWHGNPRLKLGEVREVDEDTIVAEIVTRDGSLVQKLAIDRRSGVLRQLDD